jgi:hypothetical protein
MANRKTTNNDLQNTTEKTNGRATRTTLEKPRGNSGAMKWYAGPAPPVASVVLLLYKTLR